MLLQSSLGDLSLDPKDRRAEVCQKDSPEAPAEERHTRAEQHGAGESREKGNALCSYPDREQRGSQKRGKD